MTHLSRKNYISFLMSVLVLDDWNISYKLGNFRRFIYLVNIKALISLKLM